MAVFHHSPGISSTVTYWVTHLTRPITILADREIVHLLWSWVVLFIEAVSVCLCVCVLVLLLVLLSVSVSSLLLLVSLTELNY